MPEVDADTTLQLVALETLQYRNKSATLNVHPAITALGLEDAQSLKFHVVRDGVLAAQPLPYEVDGRAEPHGRALWIHEREGTRSSTSCVIPQGDLRDGLGIEAAEIDGEQVALYGGEFTVDGETQPAIALAQPPEVTIPTDGFEL